LATFGHLWLEDFLNGNLDDLKQGAQSQASAQISIIDILIWDVLGLWFS
jgi:hypothetical protein